MVGYDIVSGSVKPEFKNSIRRQHTCMHLKVHWCDLQVCWNPARSRKNDRYGHLESNALIKIEFGEFCQKLKNLEFRQNSIFWESLGVIWIDSMSLGVVPPLSFFSFFSIIVKLSMFDGNVNYFLGNK